MNGYTRRQTLTLPLLAALGERLQAIPLDRIRLGVTTDEIDEDVPAAIRFLRSFGLSYAELRSVWGKYNTAQPLEKIREARALLDEHKIKTSVVDTAFFKIPLPPDNAAGNQTLDEQWKLLDGAMERATILGTDKLRVFAFTYKKGEKPDQAEYPRIATLLREAARRAAGRKIRLALENVAGSYVATGAEAARMFKHVPDHNFGLTWDPNNAAQEGEHPFPDGYRLLDPARIFHVHLRDYRHQPDGRVVWCAAGEGEFDNLGQIRALLKSGYNETFSLETHWRPPQGRAYASKVSLTGLLKVIEKA